MHIVRPSIFVWLQVRINGWGCWNQIWDGPRTPTSPIRVKFCSAMSLFFGFCWLACSCKLVVLRPSQLTYLFECCSWARQQGCSHLSCQIWILYPISCWNCMVWNTHAPCQNQIPCSGSLHKFGERRLVGIMSSIPPNVFLANENKPLCLNLVQASNLVVSWILGLRWCKGIFGPTRLGSPTSCGGWNS